ncbi:MAG: class I SAM-dependent methyltransferase [Anaerolineae bacterium]|nr:class I SAM-dependent methyltransferase [Anaerolineae bacterium]NUQ03113.1 class I SAM-dependent methyltransferase [Anaerolineae bacterium]
MSRSHREIIEEYFRRGDYIGWYEALYQNAGGDASAVPWARLSPDRDLVDWLETDEVDGAGRSAVVVGCGLGDDAEALAERGFAVTAFDISAEAIRWCRRRFPESRVEYVAADLFDLPPAWRGRFDLVLESRTLQSLPWQMNAPAVAHIAALVGGTGALLVLCLGRDPHEERRGIPWAQSRVELEQFQAHELHERRFDDLREPGGHRRFRVIYTR